MNVPRDPGYDVGYGAPIHSRFVKGQSGNPGGRPPGLACGTIEEMALARIRRLFPVNFPVLRELAARHLADRRWA